MINERKKNTLNLKNFMKMKWRLRILIVMIIWLMFIGVISCSSLPRLVLIFQERRYRMCEDQEMKEFRTPRDAGYACFRYCSEYKTWHSHESKNCKVWTTDVVDLTNREDFLKFRNAGFVLVDEKRL